MGVSFLRVPVFCCLEGKPKENQHFGGHPEILVTYHGLPGATGFGMALG